MRIRALPAVLLAAGLVVLTACASGGSPPPTGAEGEALFAAFSSSWVLNMDESDTFQQALEEAQGARAPGGAAGGGRGGRRGGRRGGGSGGFTDATREAPQQTMLGVQELGRLATNRLTLAVSESSLSVHPDGGIGLDLVPGESVTRTFGELQLNVTSNWDGREFNVERKVQNGATLTETFRVSDTGDRLYVERVIRTRGGPVIRQSQVYDRAN